ncbi:phosphomannomutase [Marinobacter subterrani]|uniref:Phosphomannomutase n=1 Tax=Marinobacter subterrani TaxID=1658765 RepID=A0A0J7JA10_9GAMM|nr:phosphomannomutase [Marinobacter subterrani]KMQ75037.1 Phosphomannomutase [Marinobacter subterrani]
MTRPISTTDSIIQSSHIAFGTSGARGLVEQFTADVCAAFTVAFLREMRARFTFDRVAIAIDRRPSSPQMAAACIGAANSLGLKTDYCGVLPTPALALQSMTDGIPAIMVTGSHIPFDRNGIKFYRPDGEISKADEAAIISNPEILPNYQPTLPEPSNRAKENYIHRYTSLYPASALAGLRIGLYEHSAAGRDINRDIFERLGAEVISLGRTESFVPIDTEAVSEEDRARGQQWAGEYQLDALFSTDGDGDRPLLADENGNWLRGDILGLLCAQHLNVEALAVPISCNTAIELSGAFKAVARTRIGSPYVIDAMEKLNHHTSVAGFEANGGFLTGSDIETTSTTLKALPTRDAVLPALVALSAASKKGEPLSHLLATLPQRYTASDRLTQFPTDKSQLLLATWKANPERLATDLALPADIRSIDFTDGLRATLQNEQIVHLRPSGNAPELRCYCEAETPEEAQALLEAGMQSLRKQA